MQITICPVCGHHIRWEPALDGEPHCARCGWDDNDRDYGEDWAEDYGPEYEAEMKGGGEE